MVTPLVLNTRPTNFWVRRSSTSTNLPSGLPRLSKPLIRTMARSPCITCDISLGLKNRSSPLSLVLSSGIKNPKPSGWPCTTPEIKSSLSAMHIAPLRFLIIWPSRSMALRRLLKTSRSSPLMSNNTYSCSSLSGIPCSANVASTNSRLGKGVSYRLASRAACGSLLRFIAFALFFLLFFVIDKEAL